MKITEIAALVKGELTGDGDADIFGIAALESAGPSDITFIDGRRAMARARESAAGCILVPLNSALAGKTTIAVSHPKISFIKVAAQLLPVEHPEPGTDPTAVIASNARVSNDATIGPQAVIEAGATIGARTQIAAGSHIGRRAIIGADCVIHPRVTIYPDVRIGNRVVVHSGAVIGADGFGYVFAEGRQQKFPQIGGTIIEDDVEIGANTTIDRGSLGDTVIGAGSKIDNMVQIAHNVRIGRHCVIAAQVGIAGSVTVGDTVMIGGQAGIADRARIEDQGMIGAQAGVLPGKVVRRGVFVWGTPARPLPEYKKIHAQVAELPKLSKKVEALAARIEGSRKSS
jgi:UDP-3-O-[3-hydroxymyristoyl] glucosamine N-acyltransferase